MQATATTVTVQSGVDLAPLAGPRVRVTRTVYGVHDTHTGHFTTLTHNPGGDAGGMFVGEPGLYACTTGCRGAMFVPYGATIEIL